MLQEARRAESRLRLIAIVARAAAAAAHGRPPPQQRDLRVRSH